MGIQSIVMESPEEKWKTEWKKYFFFNYQFNKSQKRGARKADFQM